MARFFNNAKYIIAFCILCVIIQLSLGEKFLEKFLMLVLFSMVILNADPVINLIKDTLGSDTNYSDKAGDTSNDIDESKSYDPFEADGDGKFGFWNPITGNDSVDTNKKQVWVGGKRYEEDENGQLTDPSTGMIFN